MAYITYRFADGTREEVEVAEEFAEEYAEMELKLSEEIHKALDILTEKQRIVFELHVSEGLPFRAIGERMSLGTYTVRDYFYNAVKKLQKFLS